MADQISRVCFPLVFVIFNLCYWLGYTLSGKSNPWRLETKPFRSLWLAMTWSAVLNMSASVVYLRLWCARKPCKFAHFFYNLRKTKWLLFLFSFILFTLTFIDFLFFNCTQIMNGWIIFLKEWNMIIRKHLQLLLHFSVLLKLRNFIQSISVVYDRNS